MKKTMTIKEIASLTGKGKSSVYRWMEKASQNGKIFSQNGNYELSEVIEIVRASGNELLANLLKDNAENFTDTKKENYIENKSEIKEIVLQIIQPIFDKQNQFIEKIFEKLTLNKIEKQTIPAIENKTETKNYKYLTLKIIGENLNPKLKPSQVGRMLFELGYAVQINNSFAPSFKCTRENKASEQSSIYGGTFYAWHKDFIDILQGLLNKETKLF